MKRFSTVEEIKAYFVDEGWNEPISFRVLSIEEAKEYGWTFFIPDIQQGRIFFIHNDTGNVYDDSGKVAMYNLTAFGNKPKMDVDGAMNILHGSFVGFSYDTDPARYTIKQADLPKLFEYVQSRRLDELKNKYQNSLNALKEFKESGNDMDYQFELGRAYALESVLRLYGYEVTAIGLLAGVR